MTIMQIDTPKESTKNLLKIISDFSKSGVFKINLPKSIVFPFPSNKQSEKEMLKFQL